MAELLAAATLTVITYTALQTKAAVVILLRLGYVLERGLTSIGYALNPDAAITEKTRQATDARKRADRATEELEDLKRRIRS